MKRDHLTKDLRPKRAKRDPVLDAQRVSAFTRWTRENFDRPPTRQEVQRFLKASK